MHAQLNKPRNYLTEDEHLKLITIGDSFWEKFSKLASQHISMMPAELEDITITYLQDKTSIYGRKS